MSEERRAITEIVAVSAEGREQHRMMIDRVHEEYDVDLAAAVTLLSDPGHAVIDRYGIFNAEDSTDERPRPHPTTYVIDTEGVVRWKMTEVDYRIRPENEDILAALREIRPDAD